ncbi:MAG: hypothetical protein ACRBCK_03290 [Alphaproteobacteria bacterium]
MQSDTAAGKFDTIAPGIGFNYDGALVSLTSAYALGGAFFFSAILLIWRNRKEFIAPEITPLLFIPKRVTAGLFLIPLHCYISSYYPIPNRYYKFSDFFPVIFVITACIFIAYIIHHIRQQISLQNNIYRALFRSIILEPIAIFLTLISTFLVTATPPNIISFTFLFPFTSRGVPLETLQAAFTVYMAIYTVIIFLPFILTLLIARFTFQKYGINIRKTGMTAILKLLGVSFLCICISSLLKFSL